MLVDSSVWIAYLRGDNLVEVDLLTEALGHGDPVWLAPPILQYRWAGVTPRSANGCLIATHAILGGMPPLHRDRDRDFGLIAGVEPKLVLVAVGP